MGNLLLRRRMFFGPQVSVSTMSFNPSSSDTTASSIISASNGYTDEYSETYANVSLATSSKSMYFYFDTSSIPAGATIVSVSCKAKGSKANQTSGGYSGTVTMGLYSGSTLKGSEVSLTTTPDIYNFVGEQWNRSELSDVAIVLTGSKVGSGSSTMRFYGATLTVKYVL